MAVHEQLVVAAAYLLNTRGFGGGCGSVPSLQLVVVVVALFHCFCFFFSHGGWELINEIYYGGQFEQWPRYCLGSGGAPDGGRVLLRNATRHPHINTSTPRICDDLTRAWVFKSEIQN